jgi:hypothetical protein
MKVTKDERFVTARHTLQPPWKIGLGSDAQRGAVVAALGHRYRECATEKNRTLIRNDIVEGLRRLHDAVGRSGGRKGRACLDRARGRSEVPAQVREAPEVTPLPRSTRRPSAATVLATH